MDNNSVLVLINVIVSLIHLFDTFIQRLKKSSCLLGSIEMKNDNKNDNENKKDDIKKDDNELNKIIELLKNNNKNKNDDNKLDKL